ncbi:MULTISPECIES: flavodoxin family protein [Bacteroides]|jgi:hypothetical protein|uniref:Iron-sulfur flavoprotein n=1 Tax=Bacteroides graminisolvens DSM 19988 = JCM 15093 TaxID=1121097 RepID=A0A069D8T1_9BACE|nr:MULTISPECIES: flavodoxin family protein [Bacteroides]GAK36599.1 iron-sulfur flavoprotein [Bacteroides graminisolvens DSM 19988 = JCM 15093]
MKRIVVITSSPHKDGNSNKLAEAFIKGATSAGHQVSRFDASSKEIKPCIGCNNCFSKEDCACISKDDFNEAATLIMQSDMVVFATPVYWYTYPAKMKAVIDKFYSFLMTDRPETKNKETLLLAAAGDQNTAVFDLLLQEYKMTVSALQWSAQEPLLVPGVLAVNDILKQPGYLSQAENLGESI